MDYEQLFHTLIRRYGEVEPDALIKVLCPLHVPLLSLDKAIIRLPGQSHWRASFTAATTDETRQVLVRGRTGKFIPGDHLRGGAWREIAKGRIIEVHAEVASGEIYFGSTRAELARALDTLSEDDLLEIDQYGAAAKVLSALVEAELSTQLTSAGYVVRRMPEDTAKHLGVYPSYDFEVEDVTGQTRKVEVKSLWGTNTRFARLIHNKSRGSNRGQPNFYETSSCKFATQDIFAVSLFLRTGNIKDVTFARSVPRSTERPYGLPVHSEFPDYVNQNPLCSPGNGTWFNTIDEVWNLP